MNYQIDGIKQNEIYMRENERQKALAAAMTLQDVDTLEKAFEVIRNRFYWPRHLTRQAIALLPEGDGGPDDVWIYLQLALYCGLGFRTSFVHWQWQAKRCRILLNPHVAADVKIVAELCRDIPTTEELNYGIWDTNIFTTWLEKCFHFDSDPDSNYDCINGSTENCTTYYNSRIKYSYSDSDDGPILKTEIKYFNIDEFAAQTKTAEYLSSLLFKMFTTCPYSLYYLSIRHEIPQHDDTDSLDYLVGTLPLGEVLMTDQKANLFENRNDYLNLYNLRTGKVLYLIPDSPEGIMLRDKISQHIRNMWISTMETTNQSFECMASYMNKQYYAKPQTTVPIFAAELMARIPRGPDDDEDTYTNMLILLCADAALRTRYHARGLLFPMNDMPEFIDPKTLIKHLHYPNLMAQITALTLPLPPIYSRTQLTLHETLACCANKSVAMIYADAFDGCQNHFRHAMNTFRSYLYSSFSRILAQTPRHAEKRNTSKLMLPSY